VYIGVVMMLFFFVFMFVGVDFLDLMIEMIIG